jgi:hypothetical protein
MKLWILGVYYTTRSRLLNLFRCWACKGTGGVRQPTFEPGVYEWEECPICSKKPRRRWWI